jgi:hypothetical protein
MPPKQLNQRKEKGREVSVTPSGLTDTIDNLQVGDTDMPDAPSQAERDQAVNKAREIFKTYDDLRSKVESQGFTLESLNKNMANSYASLSQRINNDAMISEADRAQLNNIINGANQFADEVQTFAKFQNLKWNELTAEYSNTVSRLNAVEGHAKATAETLETLGTNFNHFTQESRTSSENSKAHSGLLDQRLGQLESKQGETIDTLNTLVKLVQASLATPIKQSSSANDVLDNNGGEGPSGYNQGPTRETRESTRPISPPVFTFEPTTADGNGGGRPPSNRKRSAPAPDPNDPSDSSDDEGDDFRRSQPPKRPRRTPAGLRFKGANRMDDDGQVWGEPPCAEPPKFDMMNNADPRPYLRGVERYIAMRSYRFPSQQVMIQFAIGYLKGEKATNWGQQYEEQMDLHPAQYMDFGRFKQELMTDCGLAMEAVAAIRKMRETKYEGDIAAYISKMQVTNSLAGLTGAALTEAALTGLNSEIHKDFYRYGSPINDQEMWTFLKRAGNAHEIYKASVRHLGHDGGKPNHSEKKSQGESKGKSREDKPSGDSAGGRRFKSGGDKRKKDTSRYPKKYSSFADATEGVHTQLAEKRRKENKCGRCGIPGHDALYCAKPANTISSRRSGTADQPLSSDDAPLEGSSSRTNNGKVSSLAIRDGKLFEENSDEEVDDY